MDPRERACLDACIAEAESYLIRKRPPPKGRTLEFYRDYLDRCRAMEALAEAKTSRPRAA